MIGTRDWSKVGEVVGKIRELGLTIRKGAAQFGIKPGVIYEYNRRMKMNVRAAGEGGAEEGDGERGPGEVASEVAPPSPPALAGGAVSEPTTGKVSKRPHAEKSSPLPEEIQEMIRAHRREHPDHGFKRIQDILKGTHLVVVTRKAIRRVLKEAGLLEGCDSSFDREDPPKGTRRFEAGRPNELWQMDVTNVYIQRVPVLYLVDIIDDHSRFCLAAELRTDQCADTLIEVLHNACAVHGVPQKLLTDQGSGFYSWSREHTKFQEYLDDRKIEHLVADPHSPQTQGKVERLHQTLRTELLRKVKFTDAADAQEQIRRYVCRYNMERPHQALGGLRPADRYLGVAGEVARAEAELAGPGLDLSRGYVIYKVQEHRVCVAFGPGGLQVYLNGILMEGNHVSER